MTSKMKVQLLAITLGVVSSSQGFAMTEDFAKTTLRSGRCSGSVSLRGTTESAKIESVEFKDVHFVSSTMKIDTFYSLLAFPSVPGLNLPEGSLASRGYPLFNDESIFRTEYEDPSKVRDLDPGSNGWGLTYYGNTLAEKADTLAIFKRSRVINGKQSSYSLAVVFNSGTPQERAFSFDLVCTVQ